MTVPAIWAVIPAAGRGTRFGGEVPKQYLDVAGQSLIAHALDALLSHPRVAGVGHLPLLRQGVGAGQPRLLLPLQQVDDYTSMEGGLLRGAFDRTSAGSHSPMTTNTAAASPSSFRPHSSVRSSEPRPDSSVGEPEPTMTKKGYRLKPSSDVRTNDIDKIDLDTGCPGWGPTSIPVGRKRCGELADLIVEPYGLHAPNDQPLLAPVDGLATHTSCRDRTDGVGTILLEDLHDGAQLCVWTDKHSIAAVHINSVTETGEVVIDYELWKS